jgi:hypothetical protein
MRTLRLLFVLCLLLLMLNMILSAQDNSSRLDAANNVGSSLTLEIELDHGVITAYIRNYNTNSVWVKTPDQYGDWQSISVFYFTYVWREAPYVEKQRVFDSGAIEHPDYVQLKPGELLRPLYNGGLRVVITPPPPPPSYSFKIDLSDHILPYNYSDISKLRITAFDLWSNIITVKDPLQSLKPAIRSEQK